MTAAAVVLKIIQGPVTSLKSARSLTCALKGKDWRRPDSYIPSTRGSGVGTPDPGFSFYIHLIVFNAQNHSKDVSVLTRRKERLSYCVT